MKTVLILTYYWPPAGGPGVQRVLKFAKYLPQFGWRPVILTVANGEYPAIDESLLGDVASDLAVYKTPSMEPFSLYRKFTGLKKDKKISTFVLTEDSQAGFTKRLAAFIRGNLFIPDARFGWKPFAMREGLRLIKDENVQAIFSTAPPMSVHLIARALAKKSGLPWAADFRDPWTDVFYYHNLKRTKTAANMDAWFEHMVLKSADAVITVSENIKALLNSKVENSYHVVSNGFDKDDFNTPPLAEDGNIHIVHAGHLAVNQNPTGLWAALKKLIDEGKDLRQKLRIEFYGSIHSLVHKSIIDCGLESYAVFHSYIPHDELVAVMKRAALLFFVVPETSYAKGIPTSKLFDYMGAGRPILGIGPVDGEAAAILQQSNTGVMLDWLDEERIQAVVSKMLSEHYSNETAVEIFTRKRLCKNFVDILNELL
jgi:hypothetical protein